MNPCSPSIPLNISLAPVRVSALKITKVMLRKLKVINQAKYLLILILMLILQQKDILAQYLAMILNFTIFWSLMDDSNVVMVYF